ncbi:MAG: histidinol-phosphatase HisJ family protein [Lachnospiraceae bacterium]
MIKADCHTHTHFSTDSNAKPEEQVLAAIHAGLSHLCITDHMDIDYPVSDSFIIDMQKYLPQISKLRETYKSDITIYTGVEVGLQPHLVSALNIFTNSYPFDFIIGSTHVVDQKDPYYPDFWESYTEKEGYRKYFESTLDNIRRFDCFDVYGHIDYIVRYGPNKNKYYQYRDYTDVLDEILKTLIAKGKGIECNTGGFKYGLGHPNPEECLIKRYIELGGEILTIGSDAHAPEHIAYSFDKLPSLLKSCNVKYYTIFKNRKPFFIPL